MHIFDLSQISLNAAICSILVEITQYNYANGRDVFFQLGMRLCDSYFKSKTKDFSFND